MSALKNLRPASLPAFPSRLRTAGLPGLLAAAALALPWLAGCTKPVEKTEDVRPVRAIVINESSVGVDAEFSGEVRARIESRLGFRVGGKITERKVDPGMAVRKGQVLMQLDPQDLKLGQTQARAALRAAETARDLARAELKRYQDLKAQNFVSQAVLDARLSAFNSAQANVDAAQAAYAGQSNQAGYATLVADVDGVVTAVDAEVGQVVAPGTPVVRVARTTDKEIVIGLPEDKVDSLRKVQDVTVRLWAMPGVVIPGKIREVSPVADPGTRTYLAKVSIPDSANARLGMTAKVQFASTTAAPVIRVPLTALFYDKNMTSVWIVEQNKEQNVVRQVPVQIGGTSANDIVLASGVKSGQMIVTAGVNLLKQGQKVKILPPDPAPVGAPSGAAK